MNKCGVIITRIAARARGVLLVPCLAGLLCTAASAATYYVATNGSDAADGTNWGTAFATISNAVGNSAGGDTITVSNGTYKLTETINMYGASTRNLISLSGPETTILDGQGAVRVLTMSYGTLDGFTISNGYVGAGVNGGGINYSAVVGNNAVVKNCILVDCEAGGAGGGIAVAANNGTHAMMIISNVTFINNQSISGAGGGGLYLACNGAKITDCLFIGNEALGGGSLGGGGGMFVSSRTNTIVNCVFSNNMSAHRGGAIRCNGGATDYLIVSNCHIISNTAFRGGGLYTYLHGGASIIDCTIISNATRSNGDGGGIYMETSDVIVFNCRLIDNYAMRDGGGVYNLGLVAGCLLAGNSAGNQGGGVWQTNTAAVVRSSTIVSNAVVTNGGGVYLGAGSVENSVIYCNTAGISGSNWTYAAGSFTNTCTAPSVAAYGTGNIEDDPLFADALAGDYRLQSRSPCVNAGLNQDWMAGAIDLHGNPRIRQMIVDMGAYEGLRDGTVFSVR